MSLLPPALKPGDTVGLIAPAFFVSDDNIRDSIAKLEGIGLKAQLGQAVKQRFGYLAGTDAARAQDINDFFKNPDIKALLAISGGWGSARVLDLIDYAAIVKNSKFIIGFSDITAILLGIFAKTGMIGLHGPTGRSKWNDFNTAQLRTCLFDPENYTLQNPPDIPMTTITPGQAHGRLLGGNLSVLCSLVGSPYCPDFNGALLFIEDIGEEIYRIDRLLTQLKLAGILAGLNGVILGQFSNHAPKSPRTKQHTLTLDEVFESHFKPLNIPCFKGAAIGHEALNMTLPLGMEVRM